MVNLILRNANYLSEEGRLITGRNITLSRGIIMRISGKLSRARPAETFDASRFLLVPAYVNAHYHLGETVFRGYADTTSLEDYLAYTSTKAHLFSEQDHNDISTVSLIEALKNGTCLISCARGWNISKKSGIKGALGYPLMDSEKLASFYLKFKKQNFRLGNRLVKHGRIRKDLWIHSIAAVDSNILKKAGKIFNSDKNIHLSIHVAETKIQVRLAKSRFGLSEIETLDKYGLLDSRTNLIHCNNLSNSDISLVKQRGACITICPVSNLNLRNSIPPLKKFLSKGINVSIGTDGLATNPSASLLRSLRLSKKAYSSLNLNEKLLFQMITVNPAKTLGFPTGMIKRGSPADICIYKLTQKAKENPIAYLIAECPNPIHLLIDGRFVLKNGKILTLDEKYCYSALRKLQSRLGRKKPESYAAKKTK